MNPAEPTAAQLGPVVAALHGGAVSLQPGWEVEPVAHVPRNPVTGGLYRVSGTARRDAAGAALRWTAVLKILRLPHAAPAWLRGDRPDGWNYWQREAFVYHSGLLADLGAGLAAPRFLGLHRPDERTAWLWLEHVAGTPAADWTPQRYVYAARDLALAQGSYLAGRPLPPDSWLRHDWLSAWSRVPSPASLRLLDDDALWAHPLIRDVLPRETASATRRLAADRDRLLAAAARLPTTVCHHDFWPPNLLSRPGAHGDQTVALDWSWVGIDTAGLDPANLVLDATGSGCLPAEGVGEWDEAVLDGYLDGLASCLNGLGGAAARKTDAAVRCGHDLTAALRFGLDVPGLLALARSPDRQDAAQRRHGRPIAEIIASRAAVTRHALQLAERARTYLNDR